MLDRGIINMKVYLERLYSLYPRDIKFLPDFQKLGYWEAEIVYSRILVSEYRRRIGLSGFQSYHLEHDTGLVRSMILYLRNRQPEAEINIFISSFINDLELSVCEIDFNYSYFFAQNNIKFDINRCFRKEIWLRILNYALFVKKFTNAAIFFYNIFNLQISLALCKKQGQSLYFAHPVLLLKRLWGMAQRRTGNPGIRKMITIIIITFVDSICSWEIYVRFLPSGRNSQVTGTGGIGPLPSRQLIYIYMLRATLSRFKGHIGAEW